MPHEYTKDIGPCIYYHLNDVKILGRYWLHFRPFKVLDRYRQTGDPITLRGALGRIARRISCLSSLLKPTHHIQEAIWAHDDWINNYFHWTTDVLPKLIAWGETRHQCNTLLIPHKLLNKSYVKDSIQLLDFQATAITDACSLAIDNLWGIKETAPRGNFRSDLLNELRKKLAGANTSPPKISIYISRSDAKSRQTTNESDLIAKIKNVINIIQLDGVNFSGQIHLFSDCKQLIGPHGAGLTNMLWMPKGGEVIEIRRRGDRHNNCYFSMASALGHHYSYIEADAMNESQPTQEANLHLKINDLTQLIKSFP